MHRVHILEYLYLIDSMRQFRWSSRVTDMAIAYHNTNILQSLTLSQCKAECEMTYLCLSIDFRNNTGKCSMNFAVKEMVDTQTWTSYVGITYYQRICT